jgi:hypothetical protein
VRRLATFAWRSPPPTSVEEILAVYDDGSAWLVVRSPRSLTGAIGTFTTRPEPDDLAALSAEGPGPVTFDVLHRPDVGAAADLFTIANRVASAARAAPRATALFQAGVVGPAAAGRLSLALAVMGDGTEPVQFELEPEKCSVHFGAGGQPIAWFPMPELGSGFMTPDFEGLGGLRRRATVGPDDFGATAFEIAVPGNATTVSIQVAGFLADALPDERTPEPFSVRTDDTPISGPSTPAGGAPR